MAPHINGQPNNAPSKSNVIANPAISASGHKKIPPNSRPAPVRMIHPRITTGTAANITPPMGSNGEAT